MPAEMWRMWGHVALATVIGIAGLILLAQRREALPEADLLGVALFAVCVAYALWQVRRYFDGRERQEERREAVER
jgi:membrane protein implicated in regulation of membrane protease activity